MQVSLVQPLNFGLHEVMAGLLVLAGRRKTRNGRVNIGMSLMVIS